MNNNKESRSTMRKLGKMLGKTTVQTKNIAKSTKDISKNAISNTKSTLVNAKDDFVAGFKDGAGKEEEVPPLPEV
jgi:hypothetical protein